MSVLDDMRLDWLERPVEPNELLAAELACSRADGALAHRRRLGCPERPRANIRPPRVRADVDVDVEVAAELRGRVPVARIADELGVSRTTLRRRLSELDRGRR